MMDFQPFSEGGTLRRYGEPRRTAHDAALRFFFAVVQASSRLSLLVLHPSQHIGEHVEVFPARLYVLHGDA